MGGACGDEPLASQRVGNALERRKPRRGSTEDRCQSHLLSERTLEGSKAVKSAKGTSATFLGVAVGAPSVPPY